MTGFQVKSISVTTEIRSGLHTLRATGSFYGHRSASKMTIDSNIASILGPRFQHHDAAQTPLS
jgi:hypothetical protein